MVSRVSKAVLVPDTMPPVRFAVKLPLLSVLHTVYWPALTFHAKS